MSPGRLGLRRARRKLVAGRARVQRKRRLPHSNRRVFIDCGANTCKVLRSFIARFPDFEFFAFEPQPELRRYGERAAREHPNVTFLDCAVWTTNGPLKFFVSTGVTNHRAASTLMDGHLEEVDYSAPVTVTAIDFSEWLRHAVTSKDYVIVKMDIEAAEYPVLEKMVADGTLSLVDELFVEFHQWANESISRERHRRLVAAVRAATLVREWD